MSIVLYLISSNLLVLPLKFYTYIKFWSKIKLSFERSRLRSGNECQILTDRRYAKTMLYIHFDV